MMRLPALLASLMLAIPFAARSVPITYDLTFSGGSGPSTGSFIYDADIASFNDFTIRFDPFPDGTTDFKVFSPAGFGDFLFEILTGEPVSDAGCTTEGGACLIGLSLIGLDLEASFARSFQTPFAEYQFFDQYGVVFRGNVIAQRRSAAIAEPAGLALFGLGLLTLSLIRRRSAAPSSAGPRMCGSMR
jgi:hypothetical protein